MPATLTQISPQINGHSYQILRADPLLYWQEIGALRAKVYGCYGYSFPEYEGCSDECFMDEHDIFAMHYLAFYNGKLIGAGRMSLHNDFEDLPDYFENAPEFVKNTFPAPIISLNRLVVDPQFAGMGIAKHLERIRLLDAAKLDAKSAFSMVIGNERANHQLKLGWEHVFTVENSGLIEPDIPLHVMRHDVA